MTSERAKGKGSQETVIAFIKLLLAASDACLCPLYRQQILVAIPVMSFFIQRVYVGVNFRLTLAKPTVLASLTTSCCIRKAAGIVNKSGKRHKPRDHNSRDPMSCFDIGASSAPEGAVQGVVVGAQHLVGERRRPRKTSVTARSGTPTPATPPTSLGSFFPHEPPLFFWAYLIILLNFSQQASSQDDGSVVVYAALLRRCRENPEVIEHCH
ncbi:uncharacterized protein EI97DRAFT_442030 [Westerdykella ornata]|uniref:Uncharacterized protein n=1 Tax=Westerdykella ornata TaxID=318751 RepID=A0A6A6JKJ3_WESOR|nr:uncharacterized protein EI97DRAFT_442030 [Westerdykella ornata]KAF2276633.1 hypothetical protein EI97DRAFT_442030 [Westerdykella ornata]